MNYRHIYHAGNFADVFKHSVLSLIIAYLQRKPAAFRVIDTHAGAGLYDLGAEAAAKTAEWRRGLGRLLTALVPGPPEQAITAYAAASFAAGSAGALLAPYMQALAAVNPQGGLRYYPGSPLLARLSLRRRDRLTAIELHRQDYDSLRRHFLGDYQSRILHLDGRLALKAQLPPKEKRGLVLVDPPFEREYEFSAAAAGLTQALRRFAHGVYMLWYPVKDRAKIARFIAMLPLSAAGTVLQAELLIRQAAPQPRLFGSGLVLVNPPYILSEQLQRLEPLLLRAFAEDDSACLRHNWLKGP